MRILLFVNTFLVSILFCNALQAGESVGQKTAEEQNYIKNKKNVLMCIDPDWMPYEKIDARGEHIGIAADYMDLFSREIGLPITLVPTESWAQSEEFAMDRKCDILSMLNESPRRKKFLDFTRPYLKTSVVIIAQEETPYVDGLKMISGKTLAIVKGYVYEDLISRDYPGIKLVYAKSIDDAVAMVSDRKVHATIGSLYIALSSIRKMGLVNLKIAGPTGYFNRFRVGIRNDDPVLLQLFQKAIMQLDPLVENEILRRWFTFKVQEEIDYSIIWKALGVVALVVILFLFHAYRQRILVGKLRLAHDEIEEKNDRLNHEMDVKNRFFSIIAHDLKSPFNVLLGMTEMMARMAGRLTTEKTVEMATDVNNSSKQVIVLLENLLEWAHLQMDDGYFNPEIRRLDDAAEDALELLRPAIEAKDIRLKIDIANETLLADRNMVEAVIRNLVSNAVKFTAAGGTITLSAQNQESQVHVSVSDTGVGMTTDMIGNLFSLDKKTTTAGTEGETGTGLGLPLCKDLLDRNGGNIRAESEPGKGSTFIFTLPSGDKP